MIFNDVDVRCVVHHDLHIYKYLDKLVIMVVVELLQCRDHLPIFKYRIISNVDLIQC